MFSIHVTDNGLISEAYKELQFSQEKQTLSHPCHQKERGKDINRQFTKEKINIKRYSA